MTFALLKHSFIRKTSWKYLKLLNQNQPCLTYKEFAATKYLAVKVELPGFPAEDVKGREGDDVDCLRINGLTCLV